MSHQIAPALMILILGILASIIWVAVLRKSPGTYTLRLLWAANLGVETGILIFIIAIAIREIFR